MGRRGRNRARQAKQADAGARDAPGDPGRYTPPHRGVPIRPDWHKPLGWLIVAAGAVLAVVNDLAFVDVDLVPGGHSELYLVLALVIAGGGARLLGLFDPPQ